jgi:hypothetical protein
MPKRMTIHAEKMLAQLQAHKNRWHTRSEVAFLMKRKRLTPYDIQCLELLAEMGLIMVDKEEGYSRDGYRWLYGVFDTHPDEAG